MSKKLKRFQAFGRDYPNRNHLIFFVSADTLNGLIDALKVDAPSNGYFNLLQGVMDMEETRLFSTEELHHLRCWLNCWFASNTPIQGLQGLNTTTPQQYKQMQAEINTRFNNFKTYDPAANYDYSTPTPAPSVQ